MSTADLVFLIVVANASPILATYAMRNRFDYPLDAGLMLSDGRRLFGESKTIRGIVAALTLTTIAANVIDHPVICGVFVATFAMLGDLLSSFMKRRMRLPSSSRNHYRSRLVFRHVGDDVRTVSGRLFCLLGNGVPWEKMIFAVIFPASLRSI